MQYKTAVLVKSKCAMVDIVTEDEERELPHGQQGQRNSSFVLF